MGPGLQSLRVRGVVHVDGRAADCAAFGFVARRDVRAPGGGNGLGYGAGGGDFRLRHAWRRPICRGRIRGMFRTAAIGWIVFCAIFLYQ